MTPEAAFAVLLFGAPLPGRSLYSQVEVTTPSTVALMPTPAGPSAYQVVTVETAPPQCLQPLNPACRPSRIVRDGVWRRPETFEEGLYRYLDIATAIALETDGDDELAELVATVLINESGLRRDVHAGVGKYARGDRGRSHCLGQIMVGPRHARVPWVDGLIADDLVGLDAGSTSRCIYVTAEYVRKSRRLCARRGWAYPASCVFSAYGGGVAASHPFIKARVATLRKIREAEPQVPWWALGVLER